MTDMLRVCLRQQVQRDRSWSQVLPGPMHCQQVFSVRTARNRLFFFFFWFSLTRNRLLRCYFVGSVVAHRLPIDSGSISLKEGEAAFRAHAHRIQKYPFARSFIRAKRTLTHVSNTDTRIDMLCLSLSLARGGRLGLAQPSL
jgi:hypothetical protein